MMAQQYWSKGDIDFSHLHPRLRIIASLISGISPTPRDVLELGCVGSALQQVLPSGTEYYGIDIASDFINIISMRNDSAHYAVVDLDNAPHAFGSKQFDVVVCSGVFDYVHNRRQFLDFVTGKIGPKGYLIFTFTNRQHLRDLKGWLTGRHHEYEDPSGNFMTIRQVERMICSAGLTTIRSICITDKGSRLPLSGELMRFPFNILVRQYIFFCHQKGRSGRGVNG